LPQEYWQALKDSVEKLKAPYKLPKALPQHWINIAIGRTDFKICAIANTRDKWIGVQLVISGINALDNFRKLREKYEDDSKTNLSKNIEWAEKEGKEHHVNLIFTDTDPTNKLDWDKHHKNLNEWIGKYFIYFKDKVRDI